MRLITHTSKHLPKNLSVQLTTIDPNALYKTLNTPIKLWVDGKPYDCTYFIFMLFHQESYPKRALLSTSTTPVLFDLVNDDQGKPISIFKLFCESAEDATQLLNTYYVMLLSKGKLGISQQSVDFLLQNTEFPGWKRVIIASYLKDRFVAPSAITFDLGPYKQDVIDNIETILCCYLPFLLLLDDAEINQCIAEKRGTELHQHLTSVGELIPLVALIRAKHDSVPALEFSNIIWRFKGDLRIASQLDQQLVLTLPQEYIQLIYRSVVNSNLVVDRKRYLIEKLCLPHREQLIALLQDCPDEVLLNPAWLNTLSITLPQQFWMEFLFKQLQKQNNPCYDAYEGILDKVSFAQYLSESLNAGQHSAKLRTVLTNLLNLTDNRSIFKSMELSSSNLHQLMCLFIASREPNPNGPLSRIVMNIIQSPAGLSYFLDSYQSNPELYPMLRNQQHYARLDEYKNAFNLILSQLTNKGTALQRWWFFFHFHGFYYVYKSNEYVRGIEVDEKKVWHLLSTGTEWKRSQLVTLFEFHPDCMHSILLKFFIAGQKTICSFLFELERVDVYRIILKLRKKTLTEKEKLQVIEVLKSCPMKSEFREDLIKITINLPEIEELAEDKTNPASFKGSVMFIFYVIGFAKPNQTPDEFCSEQKQLNKALPQQDDNALFLHLLEQVLLSPSYFGLLSQRALIDSQFTRTLKEIYRHNRLSPQAEEVCRLLISLGHAPDSEKLLQLQLSCTNQLYAQLLSAQQRADFVPMPTYSGVMFRPKPSSNNGTNHPHQATPTPM